MNVQGGDVNIGAYFKGHIHGGTAIAGTVALQKGHAGRTVYLRFNGSSRCLLHRLGVGAGEGAGYLNNRRRNVGILRYG